MVSRFQSKVLSNRQVTPTVWLLRLEVPLEFDFKAGQFVMVHAVVGERKTNKAYSITSSPSVKGQIELCIKNVPNGFLSPWLCSLKEGQELELSGPHGLFVLPETVETDFVFTATGTGISSIKPMIEHLFEKGFGKQVYLFFGVRNEKEAFYFDVFENLAKNYENFHFEPIMSQPSENWNGLKGYVQDHFPNMVSSENSLIYICGLIKAVDDIRKAAERIGFERKDIKFEKYV